MNKWFKGTRIMLVVMLIVSCITPISAGAAGETVEVWFSSEDGSNQMTKQSNLTVVTPDGSSGTTIRIDPKQTYQSMLGLGTSMEETSVYNLMAMTKANRTAVLRNLFDPVDGIGMNFIRIAFGTSDFTGRAWYSYNDMPAGQTDPTLSNFSIQKDKDYNIIALLKEILELYPEMPILASIWSPPGWMKSNDSLIKGNMKSEYVDEYATYLRMAIQAYAAEGIPIYSIIGQNEPQYCNNTYPQTCWTWQNQRNLVNHLATEFANHNISTKIWIGDIDFNKWSDTLKNILDDTNANPKIEASGFHDYAGTPTNMTDLKRVHPDKMIYLTEKTNGNETGVSKYFEYLRNWAGLHLNWVTMTDTDGKPNNGPYTEGKGYFVRSSTTDPNDITYAKGHYRYGLLSKFIQKDAVRIYSDWGSSSTVTNVAFRNPDGTIVVVVVNSNSSTQSFKMLIPEGQINASIPSKSIAAYKWTPSGIHLSDNFNNGTAGSTPSGWTVSQPTGTSARVANVPIASDKSVKFVDNSTSSNPSMNRTFTAQSTPFVVEWKFKEETPGKNSKFQVHNGNTNAIDISTSATKKLRYHNGSTDVDISGTEIKANIWYKVKIIARPGSNKFDLYFAESGLDYGPPKLVNGNFRSNASSLNKLVFAAGGGADTGNVMYLDNVLVTKAEPYIEDNFNTNTTGSAPVGWTITAASSTTGTVENVPSSSDKSLKLYDNNSSGVVTAVREFPIYTGPVTWEFKFKEDVAGKESKFQLNASTTIGVDLSVKNGILNYHNGTSDTAITGATVAANTWYTIKVVANPTTGKFDLYFNGSSSPTLSQGNFRNTVKYLDNVYFSPGSSATTGATTYIDNVKVTMYE